MNNSQKIKNCKTIKNLLLTAGIDLYNGAQFDEYEDRVDEYFLNTPDVKLFKGCDNWDGQTSWCGYFTFVVQDCFADVIPKHDVTDRDILNVQNLLKVF
jgi:hypothetical protein